MKKVILGLIGSLEIETKEAGAALLISLTGQLDASTAEEVDRVLKDCIAGGTSRIAVDLSRTTYIDSFAMSVLIHANNSLKAENETLRIIGLRGKPREVFDMANVTQLFKVCENEKEALDSFK